MADRHFGRSQNFLIVSVENRQVVSTREIGTEAQTVTNFSGFPPQEFP